MCGRGNEGVLERDLKRRRVRQIRDELKACDIFVVKCKSERRCRGTKRGHRKKGKLNTENLLKINIKTYL